MLAAAAAVVPRYASPEVLCVLLQLRAQDVINYVQGLGLLGHAPPPSLLCTLLTHLSQERGQGTEAVAEAALGAALAAYIEGPSRGGDSTDAETTDNGGGSDGDAAGGNRRGGGVGGIGGRGLVLELYTSEEIADVVGGRVGWEREVRGGPPAPHATLRHRPFLH